MSITQDLRTRAKHRGKTPWQLVKTIGRLEREADATICRMVAMATEIDELTAERNALAAERDEQAIAHAATVDRLTVHRDDLLEQLTVLKTRFGSELAAEANEAAIDVPPMARIGADQDTVPHGLDVTTLWAAADAGRLGPVTNPDRTGPDDTQPIPAA